MDASVKLILLPNAVRLKSVLGTRLVDNPFHDVWVDKPIRVRWYDSTTQDFKQELIGDSPGRHDIFDLEDLTAVEEGFNQISADPHLTLTVGGSGTDADVPVFQLRRADGGVVESSRPILEVDEQRKFTVGARPDVIPPLPNTADVLTFQETTNDVTLDIGPTVANGKTNAMINFRGLGNHTDDDVRIIADAGASELEGALHVHASTLHVHRGTDQSGPGTLQTILNVGSTVSTDDTSSQIRIDSQRCIVKPDPTDAAFYVNPGDGGTVQRDKIRDILALHGLLFVGVPPP